MGTLFLAHGQTLRACKRWIGLTAQPRGRLIVDAGARRAIETGGRACWPSASSTSSANSRRETLSIGDTAGQEFARGLTNYATLDARTIRGLHTDQARAALGRALYGEVIHRDNLVLIL